MGINKEKKVMLTFLAIGAVIISAVLAACIFYIQSDDAKLKRSMKQAQKYLGGERYEKAIDAFETALSIDPEYEEAYIGLAEAYAGNDNLEKAIKILERGYRKTDSGDIRELLDEYEVKLAKAGTEEDASDNKLSLRDLLIGNNASAAPAASTSAPAESKADDAAPAESKADDAAPATDTASGELIKVGIINNDPNESGYRTANDNDLQAMFTSENGYDASFAYSSYNDEQIEAAQKFIQDEVDYLLLSAADAAGWDSVLRDAQDAGVMVILFDRTIDVSEDLYEALIVSDMAKEGETAVAWLKDQKLAEYNIIHIQGMFGTIAQRGRSGALDAAVASEGWNLVTQQTAGWSAEEAQAIVEYAIASGEKFNVIYAENDDMAKGAAAALDKANISHGVGKDVIIMSFDCSKWALEELLKQNWNYDVQCSPFHASYIDEVIKKIEGGGAINQKVIIVEDKGFDATTITQKDVNKYGI